jgi:glycosyltransferase involved in cell wall biosynthesis
LNSKYSVIIPVKNAEPYIFETIESIKSQTIPPSEVIFIDDHSTDSSFEIVQKVMPEARIYSNKSQGQASALNFGINFSTSDFITFIDADDIWPQNKNENQLKFFERNADLDAVCGGVLNFSGPFDREGTFIASRSFEKSRMLGASMFRNYVFKKFGSFDSTVTQFPFPWWSKAIDLGIRYEHQNAISVFRRVHDHNASMSKKDERRSELLRLIRDHKNRVKDE